MSERDDLRQGGGSEPISKFLDVGQDTLAAGQAPAKEFFEDLASELDAVSAKVSSLEVMVAESESPVRASLQAERRVGGRNTEEAISGLDTLVLVTDLVSLALGTEPEDQGIEIPGRLESRLCAWASHVGSASAVVGGILKIRTSISGLPESLLPTSQRVVAEKVLDKVLQVAVDSAELSLQREAFTDPLTGCLNRRMLDNDLIVEVERSRRYGHDLSVAVIDMDGLKQVNDTEGHAAGDLALLSLTEALQHTLRKTDSLYRIGGDEFVVVAPGTDPVGLANLMQRASQKLKEGGLAFTWGASSLSTLKANDMTSGAGLIVSADADLYRRRASARNQRIRERSAAWEQSDPDAAESRTRELYGTARPQYKGLTLVKGLGDGGGVEEVRRRELSSIPIGTGLALGSSLECLPPLAGSVWHSRFKRIARVAGVPLVASVFSGGDKQKAVAAKVSAGVAAATILSGAVTYSGFSVTQLGNIAAPRGTTGLSYAMGNSLKGAVSSIVGNVEGHASPGAAPSATSPASDVSSTAGGLSSLGQNSAVGGPGLSADVSAASGYVGEATDVSGPAANRSLPGSDPATVTVLDLSESGGTPSTPLGGTTVQPTSTSGSSSVPPPTGSGIHPVPSPVVGTTTWPSRPAGGSQSGGDTPVPATSGGSSRGVGWWHGGGNTPSGILTGDPGKGHRPDGDAGLRGRPDLDGHAAGAISELGGIG